MCCLIYLMNWLMLCYPVLDYLVIYPYYKLPSRKLTSRRDYYEIYEVYHSRHLYKVYVLESYIFMQKFLKYYQFLLAVAMVKKMPAYKNRLRALELECSGGSTNKKSNKQMDKKKEEDLSQELELQIKGATKPSLWELVGVHFILLPCTIAKLFLWYGHWSWRYKVKKAPYSWEDTSYLTQRTRKEDLVQRRLWVQSNLENYMAEMRKESKRRR
ncbi:hypothetical protein UlMin_035080 [Ulmus minor]